MKRFYKTYKDDEFVTTLLSQISWTNHLTILEKAKTIEERHFYVSLCASKDDEVVEYAMSRTLSPMMVAEYKLQLPDNEVLQKKLQEFIRMDFREE